MIGGIGAAVIVLLLVAVVALACASFFTNLLTAVLISLGIPVAVLLHALVGTLYAAFAILALAKPAQRFLLELPAYELDPQA